MRKNLKISLYIAIVIALISGIYTYSKMFQSLPYKSEIISTKQKESDVVDVDPQQNYYLYAKEKKIHIVFEGVPIETEFPEKYDQRFGDEGSRPIAKIKPTTNKLKYIRGNEDDTIWLKSEKDVYAFYDAATSIPLKIAGQLFFFSLVAIVILLILHHRSRRRTKVANMKSGEELVFPNIK